MHHYNFPPFSVGRDRLHARAQAARHRARQPRPAALEPMIPTRSEFPYTIRLVSETLESNGSSSMGSVCASTLALLAAGVPIKRPVAGIAMGLIKEGDDYVILTDIQGAEDHLGDMDFKVAGTGSASPRSRWTSRSPASRRRSCASALEQAREAREFILDRMAETLADAREELAEHAPRITSVKIDPEQIGLVIGKGGETIRALEADYDVQIDIEEDGTVLVYATDGNEGRGAAVAAIKARPRSPRSGTPTPARSSGRPSSARSSS